MSLTPSNAGKSLSAPPSTSHSPIPQSPSNLESSSRRPTPTTSAAYQIQKKGQTLRKQQHRSQKRPGGGGSSHTRAADEDDAMAELRAVRNASSRRGQTSITHLLNYSLPHRPFHPGGGHGYGYGHGFQHSNYDRSYRRWGLGSGHHAVDKARYVHANYRFIVSPTSQYAAQAADADEHLDWLDILQVLASAESQASPCPICLADTPTAPRMAKCGHMFCLPCLIRFMHSDGDEAAKPKPETRRAAPRWRKCPICEDSVYLADVRPVRFYAGQESPLPRPGDDVVLRLMTRNARSTLALPKEAAADVLNSVGDVPWHFAASVLDYARIMKGTGDYMVAEFDREIEELLKQEKEDEMLFHEDGEWTQRAIKAINAAKEKVAALGGMEVALAEPPKGAPSSSTGQGQHAQVDNHDFYFYASQPHLYLSPLDIRILKTKYGAFSAFPSTLLPRVEHISTGHAVDDALRKRAKYLAHLPHGCLISFLECDWTDIIPADILAAFADDIERRRKANRDKAAQEERERLQAERLEAAALHRGGARRRELLDEDAADAVAVRWSAAAGDDLAPPEPAGASPPNPRLGFAQLASSSPPGPSGQRTVWGTPAVHAGAEGGSPELVAVQRVVDDGWLRDDEFLSELGAAEVAVQMEALGVVEEVAGGVGGAASAAGGGKKKKKQKITLMSTGGRRGL